ncbi:hypothetical protein FMM05_02625 [Flavobacterium zepuense]|uniref:Lipoprotein n=1 Tax=Flavobacterium zepuense TaxID=2593302 RepID=A0A552VAP3_9FLAO|nr:hypothetical protein [Flavobacterium zepuense]TRW27553.1 hypothetical protein FMM05_02625 [Flavobacterium zepuense]
MKVLSKLMLIMLLPLLLSCNKEDKKPVDDSEIRYRYFQLENNGWKSLSHTQMVDGISYTATEVPLPYYILKDIGSDDLFKVDSIYKANNKERLIEFEFLHNGEKDLLGKEFTNLNYKDGVEYMSFNIQKDFVVVNQNNDTIQCSGVTFERNFKVAPYHKLLLFFTGINPDDKIQLVYRDNLLKKGTLKFTFNEKITKLLL